MATYLQGVTDYIPQIQPFRPDYNFLGNVLQTRQTKYDASKKQISELYGSLLNGPLSKETNIKRRDEFFKVIDNDIKRISGLDLSLQQNVDQAQNVFKGFYDDKYLVSDMVKTKNHMNELEKGENSKYCYDQDKCGGTYNETSMRKLQYKMEEFKATSDDEALNFDMGSYDAYYNWQKDAEKMVKDKGMTVTQDSESGHYIVRDKNGVLVENGLYNLFDEIYSKDPRVAANYDTKAYVFRKDSVRGLMPQYNNDEKAAERAFIQQNMNAGIKVLNKQLSTVKSNHDELKGRELELERKNGALTNKEKQELQYIKEQKDQAVTTRDNLQSKLDNIVTNMDSGDMRALTNKFDQSTSAFLQHEDLSKMSKVLSMYGAEHTIVKETAAYDLALKKNLEKYKDDLGKMRDVIQSELKKDELKYAKDLENAPTRKSTPTPELLLGNVGSNVDLHAIEHPEGIYTLQAAEAHDVFAVGNKTSLDVSYQTFLAAKDALKDQATVAGATAYLDQFYGKGKWQNINTYDEVKARIKVPYDHMLKTKKFIKDHVNTSWGKTVLDKNDIALEKLNINMQGGSAQLNNFNKGIKATVEKVGNSADPDFKLAKHLLNGHGVLDHDDKPNAGFIKAWKEANGIPKDQDISTGTGFFGFFKSDVQESFDKVKKEFFQVYNRQPKIGFDQSIDITKNQGSGMKSGNSLIYANVDSAENPQINKEVTSTLTQAFANPGKYKVATGGLDAANYASIDENPELAAALDAFMHQVNMDALNADKKDPTRPIYSIALSGIAADDLNQSGFTMTFSQDYIKKYYQKHSKDEATEGLITPELLTKGVSFFYDNTAIKTNLTEALEIKPLEKTLLEKGSYISSSFIDNAGYVKATYDPNRKTTTIQPFYNVQQGDHIVSVKGDPYVTSDIKSVDAKFDQFLLGLKETKRLNDIENEINAQKNQLGLNKKK